ncbi:methyl-accepting chemotaxis protein [Kiloniella antarctica]|uniref:Methyl-accepting chemotaxis protein n=1 Tax=Kiloniella antarctica TaxID=1550907 RepID=A0ABW5BMS4_9PROT
MLSRALTIRNSLYAVALILTGLVIYQAASSFLRDWGDYQDAQATLEYNRVEGQLITAAKFWAEERALSSVAIASSKEITSTEQQVIVTARAKADENYLQAIDWLQANAVFADKEAVLQKAQSIHGGLLEIRPLIDTYVSVPKFQRDRKVGTAAEPAITGMIMASKELRERAAFQPTKSGADFNTVQQLKDSAWIMSEYASREKAGLAYAISKKVKLRGTRLQNFYTDRGRLEIAWQDFLAYAAKPSATIEIVDVVKTLEGSFFSPDDYQALREDIFKKGIRGDDYPMDETSWSKKSESSIAPIWALVDLTTTSSVSLANEAAAESWNRMIAAAVILSIGVAAGLLSFWIVTVRVIFPVKSITSSMQELVDGNLEVEIKGASGHDEIAEMARAVLVFRDNAAEVKKLEEEHAAVAKRNEKEKRQAMIDLADRFENEVKGIVQTVSSAATEMRSTSEGMQETAGNTSQQAVAVTSASENASGNVQTVAAAAEELSSSINEISRQVSQSTSIAQDAVARADDANQQVSGLLEASTKVGEVIKLISDIAEQTNLLALNATIEAARAGDAGKGFAVVASEVKNLATQTAKATEDIAQQIMGIQGATDTAADSIGKITGTIEQINEITASVAAAVEEQGAATLEISRNVQEAAVATGEVSTTISDVTSGVEETGRAAQDVLSAASELSKQSEMLNAQVDDFIHQIREA